MTLCQAIGQATTFNGPQTLEDGELYTDGPASSYLLGFLKRGKVANLLEHVVGRMNAFGTSSAIPLGPSGWACPYLRGFSRITGRRTGVDLH